MTPELALALYLLTFPLEAAARIAARFGWTGWTA